MQRIDSLVDKIIKRDMAGCDKCQFGIVEQPAALQSWNALYLRRAVSHHMNLITYCDCQTGQQAKQYAARMWIEHGNDGLIAQARNQIAEYEKDQQ